MHVIILSIMFKLIIFRCLNSLLNNSTQITKSGGDKSKVYYSD